ncbi:MAG: hypothetical protein JW894_13415 [Bacteroidales bacterium]|nr:hypothetical protein [Bacteroidales bacterium]
MSYKHTGKILINGAVDQARIVTNKSELIVSPEDDGLHITKFNIGDFEWWYFDFIDRSSECFIKIVIHIGTDPLKTKIYPQLALSINTPERSESITVQYEIDDIVADTNRCNISIKNEVSIWTKDDIQAEYFVKVKIPKFHCDLHFTGEIEGWKPMGNEVEHQIGKKKGFFAWTIPMPKAKVDGTFIYRYEKYNVNGAIGYHDHNYNKVHKRNPLYLDELVTRWYWGKCYANRFTVIFMDTVCKTNRTLSLMVAEYNKIIHSSNNRIEFSVTSTSYDSILKTDSPSSLIIKSTDADFPFEAEFIFDKMLDSKDLLEEINPLLKWIIKKMVAKPVYYGVLAQTKIKIYNKKFDGFGNYELMVFRNR